MLNIEKRAFNLNCKIDQVKNSVQNKTTHEIILDVLANNPNNWYYAYELQGNHRLGFLSYEISARLSELYKDNLVDREKISRFYVYAHKLINNN